MEILVTGARGFVGRHLVEHLNSSHSVTAVHRGGMAENPGLENVRLVEHRLEREWDFSSKPDVLVYAGTQHRMSRTPAVARNFVNSNVLGLLNAAEFAAEKGVGRFVYFSTVTVHGNIESGTVNEASPLNAPNLYGTTKYAGESVLAEFSRDFPSTVIRLPGVVGPNLDMGRPWLATVLKKALDGDPITYRNPEALFNNVTDFDDISRFMDHLLACDAPDGCDIVYLAAREPITVREVVDTLVTESGSVSEVDTAPSDGHSFTIDTSRLSDEYGFEPDRTVDILRRFVRCNQA